ncbi:hypothetical protein AMELA_G00204740 [Ameiurus melas]|uniref:Uncharacterized protein n=1 Tax=Ameiurus melas TaxID=219545 RepID=A0A7J6A5B3_AMEME|nr:hypothetical protein AMELA_G00204740 [Ameiurus melas]
MFILVCMNGMQIESQINPYYTRYGVFRRHFSFTVVLTGRATRLFGNKSKCRVLRCSHIIVFEKCACSVAGFVHVVLSSQSDAPNLILFAHSKVLVRPRENIPSKKHPQKKKNTTLTRAHIPKLWQK